MDPKILRRFAFFASLSDGQLARILERARRLTFSEGEVVFRTGDSPGAMYLILSGRVRIFRLDSEGDDEIEHGIFGEGQLFGELAMLTGEPRIATVTVLQKSEFLEITREILTDTIASAEPDVILKIFAFLTNETRAVHEREFQEILNKRTLADKLEIERQRSLTQMVAGVAHELNTPLGVINTAASILERELASDNLTPSRRETIAEAIKLITGNIERAHRLVQDFKKVSASQVSDVKENLDIVDAIRVRMELMSVSLKRRDLRLQLKNKLPADAHTWNGYRGVLSQILINLIGNAGRYAYPEGSGGDIDVSIELEGDGDFRLIVRDHGKGIRAADLHQVFTPFFTTGRSSGGTGLGLAIVHNLVTTALQGKVWVESEEGKGAAFFVSFPKHTPD